MLIDQQTNGITMQRLANQNVACGKWPSVFSENNIEEHISVYLIRIDKWPNTALLNKYEVLLWKKKTVGNNQLLTGPIIVACQWNTEKHVWYI